GAGEKEGAGGVFPHLVGGNDSWGAGNVLHPTEFAIGINTAIESGPGVPHDRFVFASFEIAVVDSPGHGETIKAGAACFMHGKLAIVEQRRAPEAIFALDAGDSLCHVAIE